MSEKSILLAERRQRLIQKAATQRVALAQSIEQLQQPLMMVHRGMQVVQYVRKHPVLMLGATTLLGIIRPERLSRWLHTGWTTFLLVRNIRSWLEK